MTRPLFSIVLTLAFLCAAATSYAATPTLIRVTAPQVSKQDVIPSRLPVGGPANQRFRQIPFRPVVPLAVFRRLKLEARTNRLAPTVTNPIDEKLLKPLPFAGRFLSPDLGRFTPVASVKFQGLNDINNVEPPDMAIAVSPSFVVQAVNDSIAVFSRAGVRQTGFPKSNASFFHIPSPGSCDPVPFTSDPRAFYDSATGRFFVTILQVDGPLIFDACPVLSKYWIAVSGTSNPTGTWHIYSFDMRAGTSNAADFTETGFDANGFYFSGNMFNPSGNFQYAELFGVSKAALIAGASATAHGFAGTALGDTVQPVNSLSQPRSGTTAVPVEFFAGANNFTCGGVCSGVHVFALANGATASPSLTAATIATRTYAFPPDGYQTVANFPISTGDLRISGTPVFFNGVISYSQNVGVLNGLTNVPAVYWEQVRPTLSGTSVTGGAAVQGGNIAFAGSGSAYYGAITPDSRGNVYINYGMSSISTPPGALLSARLSTDALNTMETPVVVQAGSSFYVGGRWGDYSAIGLDGLTSTSGVWSATEFTAGNDWRTEIANQRFP